MSLRAETDFQNTSQQSALSRSKPNEIAQHGAFTNLSNESSRFDHSAPGEGRVGEPSGEQMPHPFDAEPGSTLDDAYYARKKAALRSQHKHKGKGRQSETAAPNQRYSPSSAQDDSTIQGYLKSAIGEVPTEVLMRIFSYLDVVSLARSALVCSFWAAIIHDDTTWRLAFATHFNIRDQSNPMPSLRRTQKVSWKQEYIRRSDLLRRWRKSRTATILTDPRIGIVSSIAISLQHRFMLSASSERGVGSRSDPFTGKVAKGLIEGISSADAGAPVVCVLAIDADGSRVVWGTTSGDVRVSILNRAGANPRGMIRMQAMSPRDAHVGALTDIALPFASNKGGVHAMTRSTERLGQRMARLGDAAHAFVTAGEDGTVRLWSPKHKSAVWVGNLARMLADQASAEPEPATHADGARPQSRLRPAPIDKVDFHPTGIIVAAARDGTIACWQGFDLSLLDKPVKHGEDQLKLEPTNVALLIPNASTATGAADVVIDDRSADSAQNVSVLVRFNDVDHFWRLDIEFSGGRQSNVTFCCFGTSSLSKITSLRADFDLEEKAASSRGVSPYQAAIMDQANTNEIPPLVLGPSKQEPRIDEDLLALRERKYVCAGTSEGALNIYRWDLKNTKPDPDPAMSWDQTTKALRNTGAAFSLSVGDFEITALDFNAHAIFCGTSDGSIRVFDSLTGHLIRTFADRAATRHPARMLAAGELTEREALRFRVSQISATDDAFVAIIGSHVLAWRCDPSRHLSRKGGKLGQTIKSKHPLRRLDPKFQAVTQLDEEMLEGTEKAREEASQARSRLHETRQWQQGSVFDDMTEQEAFAYATMLSRDEEEARIFSGAQNGHIDEEDDLQEALRAIEISEEQQHSPHGSQDSDDAYADHSSEHLYGASPGPSPSLRGVSSPHRAWTILSNARGSTSSPAGSSSNNKVQTVQVPRSARISSSTSRQQQDGHGFPELASPTDWPSVSPLSTSLRSSSFASSASGSRRASENNWSRRPSIVQGHNRSDIDADGLSSSLGVWAAGSPMRRGPPGSSASNSPSLLARDLSRASPSRGAARASPTTARSPLLQATTSSSGVEMDAAMDDDLRFAIELSLAEERSKRQA